MPLGQGRRRHRVLVGVLLALVTGGAGLVGSVVESGAAGAQTASVVVTRGAAASVTYAMDSTTSITLSVPTGAVPGDALIASLGIVTGSNISPALIAPSGWTLASRTDASNQRTLRVFWHLLAAGESRFTWTTDVSVGGSALLAAFSGTDPTSPVEVSSGRSVTRTTSVSSPSVTTGVPDAGLVSSYLGYTGKKAKTNWNPPSAMTELGGAGDGSHVSGSIDFVVQAAAGASGQNTATASVAQDYAIAVLTSLRPASPPADSTAPVISGIGIGSLTPTRATASWTTAEDAPRPRTTRTTTIARTFICARMKCS